MKIYNSLTRKKEAFTNLADGPVKMYICGPTVYDKIHIGNARPMVVFDAFRRYLLHKGFSVIFASNFTDIDDRIIKKAVDEGVSAKEVSEKFIAEYLKDSEGLNCLPADITPKVTDEVEGIIGFIKEIIDNGYAYESGGTVFFDTKKKGDYGKLSGRVLEDMLSGARVEVDAAKKSPSDFVLWKPAKDGEPSWESPWGHGRPGWHIECSHMIRRHLGKTIDIHGGGPDLLFPHHENELAQSEAANGCAPVRYWMHNGFINIDGEKMAKSAGNFFTVRDLALEYGYDAIRFYILSFHYRSPINFAPEHVAAAKSALGRIKNCVEMFNGIAGQALSNASRSGRAAMCARNDGDGDSDTDFEKRFFDALDDDFNTAEAIGVIFELVKQINNTKDGGLLGALTKMCGILGFDCVNSDDGEIDSEIKLLLDRRAEARKNKDFALSDELRRELQSLGVAVKDTREGQVWSYAD